MVFSNGTGASPVLRRGRPVVKLWNRWFVGEVKVGFFVVDFRRRWWSVELVEDGDGEPASGIFVIVPAVSLLPLIHLYLLALFTLFCFVFLFPNFLFVAWKISSVPPRFASLNCWVFV